MSQSRTGRVLISVNKAMLCVLCSSFFRVCMSWGDHFLCIVIKGNRQVPMLALLPTCIEAGCIWFQVCVRHDLDLSLCFTANRGYFIFCILALCAPLYSWGAEMQIFFCWVCIFRATVSPKSELSFTVLSVIWLINISFFFVFFCCSEKISDI